MLFAKTRQADNLKERVNDTASSAGHIAEEAASYVAARAKNAALFIRSEAEDIGENIRNMRHNPTALLVTGIGIGAGIGIGLLLARMATKRR